MEIQIISRESVKPSSPTPNHLKDFKLSLLDQLIPAPYAPLVLFYPNYDGATHPQPLAKLSALKQSLAETLTRFYPLAGVIKDELSIDCNDEGAFFATAEVLNCHLSGFLDNPDLGSIPQLLPCKTSFQGSTAGSRVTNIQVNVFECGGLAIGLCISHKIVDGAALSTFLKAWADAASGCGDVYPDFVAGSLFPANDDLWLQDASMEMWGSLFKKGKPTTRRFVFNASSIASLRGMIVRSAERSPTRIETVSAFIWKIAMAASEQSRSDQMPSLLTHVVNLRRRAVPNFSEYSMENLIWISSAKFMTENEVELPALTQKVAESILNINSDYVKKLRGHEGHDLMRKSLQEIGAFASNKGVNYYGFTSWCKFGFYDIDFGWGKPAWVSSMSSGGAVFMNLIILMETGCGDGIEAWVTLDQQEMELFQSNPELQAFTEMDPSPLKFGFAVRF